MSAEEFQYVTGKRAAKRRKHKIKTTYAQHKDREGLSVEESCSISSDLNKICAEIKSSTYLLHMRGIFQRNALLARDPDADDDQPCVTGNHGNKPTIQMSCQQFGPVNASQRLTNRNVASSLDENPASERTIQELVCYGIGNFASDIIARYQLSLFLILREDLKIPAERCSVYDPVLSDGEREILKELNCEIIPVNEEGKRRAKTRTLFFMPHCGKALYNNLLWANWSVDQLCKIVILGNSFSHMQLSTPSRFLKREAAFIVKALPNIEESVINNIFHHTDIFNDLSLHLPNTEVLHTLDSCFWTDVEEPHYDDTTSDIVFK